VNKSIGKRKPKTLKPWLPWIEKRRVLAYNSYISHNISRRYNEEKKQMFGKKPVW
jgi:hypothetical protein